MLNTEKNFDILFKETEELNDKKEYQKVIDLLLNNLLEKYNRAELYTERARAHSGLKQRDLQKIYLDKANESNPSYFKQYNSLGLYWNSKKEYEKAIEEYNKGIKANPTYRSTFYNRGSVWKIKKEYDKAIEDYTKTISLDPNFASAYYSRGLIWKIKKEYGKAIADFTQAIKLKEDFANAYNGRGASWHGMKDEKKAIADYDKAIKLNPTYTMAYFNRGVALSLLKEYDKAMTDLIKVSELRPNYGEALNNIGVLFALKKDYKHAVVNYKQALQKLEEANSLGTKKAKVLRNLGDIYVDLEQFELAINFYQQAIALDKKYNWLQITIDEIKAKTKNIKDVSINPDNKADVSLYYLVDAIDKLNTSETNKNLLKVTGNIFLQALNAIRDYSFASNTYPVAHYTKLKVADILVTADLETRLRYYNVVYMNDPEEGEILFDCLDDDNIKESFSKGMEVQENNIYLGSFLPAEQGSVKNNHEDELVMWRTYGKDELKNEASGCSIIINPDFFGKEKQYLHSDMYKNKDTIADIKAIQNPQSLYSVLYYDRRDKKLFDPKNDKLNERIDELKSAIKSFISLKYTLGNLEDIAKAIDKIVYRFLSEIRYLFKSSDYAFENELRVVQYATPQVDKIANLVKIDDNGGQWLPRRLYIESNKPVREHIARIYLGPKVQNPQTWMYLEASMKLKGFKMELKPSICKFI